VASQILRQVPGNKGDTWGSKTDKLSLIGELSRSNMSKELNMRASTAIVGLKKP